MTYLKDQDLSNRLRDDANGLRRVREYLERIKHQLMAEDSTIIFEREVKLIYQMYNEVCKNSENNHLSKTKAFDPTKAKKNRRSSKKERKTPSPTASPLMNLASRRRRSRMAHIIRELFLAVFTSIAAVGQVKLTWRQRNMILGFTSDHISDITPSTPERFILGHAMSVFVDSIHVYFIIWAHTLPYNTLNKKAYPTTMNPHPFSVLEQSFKFFRP
jgi:hypothetical protein